MSDNIQHVSLPSNQWIDLYASTGITVGTVLNVENAGNADVNLAVQAAQPDNDHIAFNVLKRPPSVNMQNSINDLGAWAYSPNTAGRLAISSSSRDGFIPATDVRLLDGFGNPLNSYFVPSTGKYAIDIHDADVHDKFINQFFHFHTAISTTLAVATTGDGSENIIVVADGSQFAVGDFLHIDTTSVETTHPQIVNINVNAFTLDRRLDNAHDVGDTILKAILNMAPLLGSTADPVEYVVGPEPGSDETWDITRLLFEMTHDTAGDLGKFGGIPALINGVFIRVRNNGQYRSLTNWKTNGNIKVDMFDVDFDARSGGQGEFGTSGRITLAEMGAIARLVSATNDQIEIYVQDDISALIAFTMKAQGHLEVI